mgnify:CR=1 FL=1
MKRTYSIQGMTCNGCRAGVEEKLSLVTGVSSVSVSLEKEEAVVEMQAEVPLDALKNALPVKYTITPKEAVNVFPQMRKVIAGFNFIKNEEDLVAFNLISSK